MNHSHLESIAISALFRFAHFWKVPWTPGPGPSCSPVGREGLETTV
jgi:hypothetical protein